MVGWGDGPALTEGSGGGRAPAAMNMEASFSIRAEPLRLLQQPQQKEKKWEAKEEEREAGAGMRTLGGSARQGLVIVPKVVKEHKLTKDFPLGRGRSYGFTDPEEWGRSGDKRFQPRANREQQRGRAANGFQVEQPSVKELLSSWAVHANAAGEVASGKEGTVGESNGLNSQLQRATLEEKSPAVAAAIRSKPKLGDEATAAQLLYPSHYVTLGVDSKNFAGGRQLDDIRNLCVKCNFGLTEEQIQKVFSATAVEEKCGIEQFKNAARALRFM